MTIRTPRRPSHPDAGTQPYFVTTRTANSCALFRGPVASLAQEALLRLRERYGFSLMAYVFMPDHAHLVIVNAPGYSISQTMRIVKGAIARAVNQSLGRTGPVWQDGFYDRVPRTVDDLNAFIEYVHDNPVRAGLSVSAAGYQWSSALDGSLTDYRRYFEAVRE